MGKFNFIAATVLGLGLGFAAAPAAHASGFNLIPEQEGEVKLTNFGLETTNANYMGAIDSENLIDLGFSVTSLDYTDNSFDTGLSRLFIDNKATANTYGSIKFGTKDAGTNEGAGEYWLRSVATNSNGNLLEKGNLEVGLFEFDFGKTVDRITLDFFDTETSGVTGIVEVNGEQIEDYLASGADGNIQRRTLENVSSFTLKVGEKFSDNKEMRPEGKKKWMGDGVTLTGFKSTTDFAKTVPEPTTTFSLGALAVAGMFGVKKRKNLKK